MKISSTPEPLRPDRLPTASGETRAVNGRAGSRAVDDAPLPAADLGARLTELEGRFSGDFDAAKVAQVKQAMAEGRFKVNVEAVADRLIASVGELLGRRA